VKSVIKISQEITLPFFFFHTLYFILFCFFLFVFCRSFIWLFVLTHLYANVVAVVVGGAGASGGTEDRGRNVESAKRLELTT